jgi:hypothetical protein
VNQREKNEMFTEEARRSKALFAREKERRIRIETLFTHASYFILTSTGIENAYSEAPAAN